MKVLQQRLTELRNDKGLSQKELAKNIGASDSAICFWENGVNEPKATYIYQMAQYFDVSADYLLGLEDETGARPSAPMGAELPHYSAEERKLIENYRELNASGKNLVQETAKTLRATVGGSDKKETRA